MRIRGIRLVNYRQYQDAVFDFQKNGNYDLNVIIGRNTLGKTDFLNSITWCLYNEEPHLGLANNALPVVNVTTVKETPSSNNCITIVEILLQSNTGQISIKREMTFRKSDTSEIELSLIKNTFEICVTLESGSTKIFTDDKAEEWVKRLFPKGLREFFFFDGEQLTQYFISDKRQRIETSINEISQVGLLNKVSTHLNALISDIKKKTGRDHPDIDRLLLQLESAQNNKKDIENDLDVCIDQIHRSEEIIRTHNDFLRGQENILELENRRKDLLEQKKNIQQRKDQISIDFKNFIREYTTWINLYPKIHKTLEIIKEKESKGKLPPNVDRNFLREMIDQNECLICLNGLNETGRENIRKLLDVLEFSSEVANRLSSIKGPLENIEEKVRDYEKNKQKLLETISNIENEENRINGEFSRIESQLLNVNDKESIINAITERNLNESLKTNNLRKQGNLEERLKKVNDDLQKIEILYDQALARNSDQNRLRSLKEFSEKALCKANLAKSELMKEMREKTRLVMQDLFLSLTWSRQKYKEVTIAEDYSLGLMHNDGYECLGSCAASERALLALSFTLALHRVSGFDVPLVIDTPGANISDKNRLNFALTLKEISREKQIILLFTPSEYGDEINSIFDPIISTKLILDTENGGETVKSRRVGNGNS